MKNKGKNGKKIHLLNQDDPNKTLCGLLRSNGTTVNINDVTCINCIRVHEMVGFKNIKKHLENGRSITGIQSLRLYGVYRLSDVIYKLRKNGYNIHTEIITGINRKTYGCYTLIENKSDE